MRQLFEDIAAYRKAYEEGAAIPIQESGAEEPLGEDDENYEPGHHYGFEVTLEQQKELDSLLLQIDQLESQYGPQLFLYFVFIPLHAVKTLRGLQSSSKIYWPQMPQT